jgi:hypothetical protein
VVILAQLSKEEMDKELQRELMGFAMEWHTREGAPHSSADLERVAAGSAHTVVLLEPDAPEVLAMVLPGNFD